jgi:hypothetical protein
MRITRRLADNPAVQDRQRRRLVRSQPALELREPPNQGAKGLLHGHGPCRPPARGGCEAPDFRPHTSRRADGELRRDGAGEAAHLELGRRAHAPLAVRGRRGGGPGAGGARGPGRRRRGEVELHDRQPRLRPPQPAPGPRRRAVRRRRRDVPRASHPALRRPPACRSRLDALDLARKVRPRERRPATGSPGPQLLDPPRRCGLDRRVHRVRRCGLGRRPAVCPGPGRRRGPARSCRAG